MERQTSGYPEAVNITLLNRRAFLSSLALLAVSCATPGTESVAKLPQVEPSSTSVPPTEVPKPPTATVEVRKPGEITASIAKFVDYSTLDDAIQREIIAGTKMPLPFGEKSLPVVGTTIFRRIRATDPRFGPWVGKDIVESFLGFTFSPNTEIVAFAKGSVFIQPPFDSGHGNSTTRYQFTPEGSAFSYVYRVGGKPELLADIPTFPSGRPLVVEAGQPFCRVTAPAVFPSFIPLGTIVNPSATYHMVLDQFKNGNSLAENYYEKGTDIVGSQLPMESLLQNETKAYIGIKFLKT